MDPNSNPIEQNNNPSNAGEPQAAPPAQPVTPPVPPMQAPVEPTLKEIEAQAPSGMVKAQITAKRSIFKFVIPIIAILGIAGYYLWNLIAVGAIPTEGIVDRQKVVLGELSDQVAVTSDCFSSYTVALAGKVGTEQSYLVSLKMKSNPNDITEATAELNKDICQADWKRIVEEANVKLKSKNVPGGNLDVSIVSSGGKRLLASLE